MFFIDRPISDSTEDKLNLLTYSIQIAKGIKNWTASECGLVIAIYGPWGSGKTSAKNLICNELREDTKNAPAIINFNPWIFKGHEDLARQLLSLIGREVAAFDPTKEAQLSKKWNKWAATMAMLGKASATLGSITNLLGVPLVGELTKIFGSQMSDTAEAVSQALTASADVHDVESMRMELFNMLQQLPRPILIIVDDIDRLTNEEIRLLFQVIKTHCDFPNLGFLLLCQQESIEASLSTWMPNLKTSENIGRLYLDKIVHVGLSLPPLRIKDSKSFLISTLQEALPQKAYEDNSFEIEEIATHIAPAMDTIRRIKRFGSVLSFQAGIFTHSEELTIHPVDLIGIEWLRVNEPSAYLKLSKNLDKLFNIDWKGFLLSLTNNMPHPNKLVAMAVLENLLPWAKTGRITILPPDSLRLARRENFDHYFDLVSPIRVNYSETMPTS